MSTTSETSDSQLLGLLRRLGPLSVTEVAAETQVTATAVRQRLSRLMGQGLVLRDVSRSGRGRPSHRYSLTEKARRQAGSNFSDLAVVLWEEIRAVQDPQIRRGLLQRLAASLARLYSKEIQGATTPERLESLRELFARRGIALQATAAGRVTNKLVPNSTDANKRDASGAPDCAHLPSTPPGKTPDPVDTDGSFQPDLADGETAYPQMSVGANANAVLRVMDCPYPELAEQDRGICAVEKMLFAELLEAPTRLTQCRLEGHSCCQFETRPLIPGIADSPSVPCGPAIGLPVVSVG